MLLEKITGDMLSARKSGNTAQKNVLSTLIGEMDKKSKEVGRTSPVTDGEAISIIKKLISSNVECNTIDENVYLECYLPKVLSLTQLTSIVERIVEDNSYSTMKDMGKVMSYLSENYAGEYDGKMASEVIKTFLS
jgi:hypothetical protein